MAIRKTWGSLNPQIHYELGSQIEIYRGGGRIKYVSLAEIQWGHGETWTANESDQRWYEQTASRTGGKLSAKFMWNWTTQ